MRRFLILVFAALAALLLFAGCSEEQPAPTPTERIEAVPPTMSSDGPAVQPTPPPTPEPTPTPTPTPEPPHELSLRAEAFPMYATQTRHITADTVPADLEVTWTSSDECVATVEQDGTVHGLTAGTAIITAWADNGDIYDRCTVTVSLPEDLSYLPQKYMYQIRVNKQVNVVTIYTIDEEGEYTVPIRTFYCSTGYKTPEGTCYAGYKKVWHALLGNYWGQYTTYIAGNFLFHSVPAFAEAKDSLNMEYYNLLGTAASGGCVRLQVINAKWIYENCPINTVIKFYWDEDPGPLGWPQFVKMPLVGGWDPTDPDPENPWNNGEPEIHGVRDIRAATKTTADFLSGVTATDSLGTDITDLLEYEVTEIEGETGVYNVRYSVTDASYKTVYKNCKLYIGS
jgi:hypothetical protein